MDQRIGYCCKLLSDQTFDSKKAAQAWLDAHNGKSTTVAYLDKQSYSDAVEKVRSIIAHNQQALMNQFRVMATWPKCLHMVRVGSEQLPVRTFPKYKKIYDEPVIIAQQQVWQQVGDLARDLDIRLSSHPGPYTILTSDNADVVDRAIEDLEYHADIFRLMGYDASDQRQEINIHGGPRRGDMVERFRAGMRRLSGDTQQWLSIENDEFSHGLDDILPLADQVKIVLDINHHWIKEGEYLQPDDARMQRVVESWRGVRPEIHVAYPTESVLGTHDVHTLPDMAMLESQGIKKTKLRAHSDQAWNLAISKYALGFWHLADLCVEAKHKNLASHNLYNLATHSK